MTKIDEIKEVAEKLRVKEYFSAQYQRILKNGDPFLCDLYHITMGYVWHKTGRDKINKTSEAFTRRIPFDGAYLIATGQGQILEWVKNWHVTDYHIDLLRSFKGRDGGGLFDEEFLEFFKNMKLDLNVDGVKEGEVMFTHEPFLSVTGPCWQVDMVEAAFLNIMNSSSLVTTKAARAVQAASSDGIDRPVLEFGLRRGLEIGGLGVSRSAYLGGCTATSNVLACGTFGIKESGTMAHSYVQSYEEEIISFEDYIKYTNGARIVLVDTTDTYCGVIEALEASRRSGIELDGMRIDSGDLAFRYKQARELCIEAGKPNVMLIASNDLNEYTIQSLIQQKATYDAFALGTKVAVPDEAMPGVFKTVFFDKTPVMKLAEGGKMTDPYAKDIIRIINEDGTYGGDILIRKEQAFTKDGRLIKDIVSIPRDDLAYPTKEFLKGTKAVRLHKPMVRNGQVVTDDIDRSLDDIRLSIKQSLKRLDPSHLRFEKPHRYGVGLEESFFDDRAVVIRDKKVKLAMRKAKCEQMRARWRAA